ncbi:MAG: cobyrinate a,c-diamide synthase [Desulfobacula sp.]|nr:cobyrinate a,c-diamide synthase [Desulfobacula sp.]
MKGFIIGAAGSGSGKTTVSIAILSYLASKGVKVAPFKVGPDFIDPGHHSKIAEKVSFNLDSWMLSKPYNRQLFAQKTKDCDIAVVEGVMGLFDGYDGLSEAGSTAQMAKWLDLPVVLVVNAKGMARSAAAIIKGFESFDKDLNIAGVVFTKIGGQSHYKYLKAAVEQNCDTKCLGFMPINKKISMPERHLGLVTADELSISKEVLSLLSKMVEDHIDMETLINSLCPVDLSSGQSIDQLDDQPDNLVTTLKSKSMDITFENPPTIAVARDKAFCFYYQDNLEILEKYCAKIIEFSPLEQDQLPDNIDGIYFGGGYPELFAKKVSRQLTLLRQVKEYSDKGRPIYAEGGGFMFLCDQMSGMDEPVSYTMSGCFDFKIQMSKKLRSLGYREITLKKDTIIGKKGDVLRGHEFHYSSLEHQKTDTTDVYDVTSRAGQNISLKGYQTNNTLGSYLHIHFGSNENCAKHFVDNCQQFKKERISWPKPV